MAPNSRQLLQQLIKIGLITAGDAQALPFKKDPTPQVLLEELVRRGKLTKFQAVQALRGHASQLVLGKYLLLDKLGAGGMGQVYRAQHLHMKREVAVKVMSPALLVDQDAIRRFHREIEAAAQLVHPNIVTSHDADVAGNRHFLVMELIKGINLDAVVKQQGPLPLPQAIDCLCQVARGLEYAHQRGIIHRDIKPANLLWSDTGVVKILDLGLARCFFQNVPAEANLTGTGSIMGTVDYMSPEQAVSPKDADARSDQYSLGCTLHYLLSGRPLFREESIMQRLLAHRQNPAPTLQSVCAEVPAPLEAIYQRMVAKQPAERFRSMSEVEEALAAVSSLVGVAHPVGSGIGNSKGNPVSQSADRAASRPDLLAETIALGGGNDTFPVFATEPGRRGSRDRSGLSLIQWLILAGLASLMLCAVVAAIVIANRRGDHDVASGGPGNESGTEDSVGARSSPASGSNALAEKLGSPAASPPEPGVPAQESLSSETNPGSSPTADAAAPPVSTEPAAPRAPATLEEALQTAITVNVYARSLEGTLNEILSKVKSAIPANSLAVEGVILVDDTLPIGVARDRVIAELRMTDQPASAVLTELMRLANPTANVMDPTASEQQLMWVIAPHPADPTTNAVLITTRGAATKKRYAFPAAFGPAPPAPLPTWLEEERQFALDAPVAGVAFSHAKSLVAGVSETGKVRVWSSDTGEQLQELHFPRGIPASLAFAGNGGRLIVGGERGCEFWDTANWSSSEVAGWSALFADGNVKPATVVSALQQATRMLCAGDHTGYIWVDERGVQTATGTIHPPTQLPVLSATERQDRKRLALGLQTDIRLSHQVVTAFGWQTSKTQHLSGHTGAVVALAFSPDLAYLASGSLDQSLRLWKAETGDPLELVRLQTEVVGLTFSADSKELLAATRDGELIAYAVPGLTKTRSRKLVPGSELRGMTMSVDGTSLATAGSDGMLRLWRYDRSLPAGPDDAPVAPSEPPAADAPPKAPKQWVQHWKKLAGLKNDVIAAALTADRKQVVALDGSGKIALWNVADGMVAKELAFKLGKPQCLAMLNAESKMAVGGTEGLAIYDLSAGTSVSLQGWASLVKTGKVRSIRAIAPVPNVADLYVAPDTPTWLYVTSRGINTVDMRRLELTETVVALATRNDRMLLVVGGRSQVYFERPGSFEAVKAHAGEVNHVVFSRDERWLATASRDARDRVLQLWNPDTSKMDRNVRLKSPVTGVRFIPSGGAILASTSSGELNAFSVPELIELGKFEPKPSPAIHALALSGDGTLLVTGGPKGEVNLWDLDPDFGAKLKRPDAP